MPKEIPDTLKQFIRALLISSSNGVQQMRFVTEYKKYTGESGINWRELGFKDLYEFLLAMPDVARVEYSPKHCENLVFGVAQKNVYASNHAKKAASKSTGLPSRPPSEWGKKATCDSNTKGSSNVKSSEASISPGRTVNVANDSSTLKVTLAGGCNSNIKLIASAQGWYGVHISNLPNNCSKEDIEKVFSVYGSLRETKIVNRIRQPIAFAKYAKHDDALRALLDMDGYVLKGHKLRVKPATDRLSSPQNDTASSGQGKQSQMPSSNKTGPMLTSPRPNQSSTQMRTTAEPSTDRQSSVNRSEGYPIHVSYDTPLPYLTEIELSQVFALHGNATKIDLYERHAIVWFENAEEVMAVMLHQEGFVYSNTALTVRPWTEKSLGAPGPLSPQAVQEEGRLSSPITTPGPWSPKPNPKAESSTRMKVVSNSSKPYYPDYTRKHSSGSASSIGSGFDTPIPNGASASCGSADTGYGSGDNKEMPPTNTNSNQGLLITPHTQHNVPLTVKTEWQDSGSSNYSPLHNQGGRIEVKVHLLLSRDEMEMLVKSSGQQRLIMNDSLPDEFDVLVTEVVDSCHFWAIISDGSNNNWTKLEELREKLQRLDVKPMEPQKHTLGAAKFSEDNMWYRCFVLDVSPDKQVIKVLYADYGNAEWVSTNQFSFLDKSYWELHPQAIPFRLAGLEATTSPRMPSGNAGAVHLSDMICNKACRAKKRPNTSPAQPHVLEVELFADNESVNNKMEASSFVKKVEPKPAAPKQLFEKKHIIPIRLTWVESTEKIYFQEMTPAAISQRQGIEFVLKNIPLSEKMFPQKGFLACLVTLSGSRARVLIQELMSGGYLIIKAKVLNVDTGQTDIVQVDQLLCANAALHSFPFQARTGILVGVKPPGVTQPNWDRASKALLLDKKFERLEASIVNQFRDHYELELFDEEGASLNLKILEAETAAHAAWKLSSSQLSLVSVGSNSSDKSIDMMTGRHGSQGSIKSTDQEDWENDHRNTNKAPMSATSHTLVTMATENRAFPDASIESRGYQPLQHQPTSGPASVTSVGSETTVMSRQGSSAHAPGFYMPPPPDEAVPAGSEGVRSVRPPPQGVATPLGGRASPLPTQPGVCGPHRTSPKTVGGRGSNLTSPPQLGPNIYSRRPAQAATSNPQNVAPGRVGQATLTGGAGMSGTPQTQQNVGQNTPITPQGVKTPQSYGNTGSGKPQSPFTASGQQGFGNAKPSPLKGQGGIQTSGNYGPSQASNPVKSGQQGLNNAPKTVVQEKGTGQTVGDFNVNLPGNAPSVPSRSEGFGSKPNKQQQGNFGSNFGSRTHAQSGNTAAQQTADSAGLKLSGSTHAQTGNTAVQQTVTSVGSQPEVWKKEREELQAKCQSQKARIASLKEDIKRPVDLAKLKERLEKQVRVTEIENKVIKLRKEIEQLETTKAQLQLELLNP